MPKDYSTYKFKGVPCPLLYVEGGRFMMGSEERERERPPHRVIVPSFYIGQYPVTQDLYGLIMKTNPSRYKGARRPVEKISWDDTKMFFKKIKEETGRNFRLPSESEWEFAARGGIYSQGYEYSGSDDLKQVGWYDEKSGDETMPVGLLLSNELDLYDMSGNVCEWCEDDYYNSYKYAPDDGSAWFDVSDRASSRRVIRGGSCFDGSVGCRSAYRLKDRPSFSNSSIGFRLVFSV